MELLQLRYFYTVGKMLNISKAAKVYSIPQPAMSKMISNLEVEVKTKLFDRTKNHLSLTPAGCLFLAEVEQALYHLDSGIRKTTAQNNLISGNLRLLVMYHRNTIMQCIERFTQRYPNISFQIFNNAINSQSYDLCIGGSNEGYQYDSTVPLLKEEIRLFVPLNHPLAKKDMISVSDVKEENFIITSYDSEMFQLFSTLAKDAGFSPVVSVACNDLYCIRQYFSLNMGVSLVPIYSWSGLFDGIGRIIPFETPIYRTIHMFWNMHNLSNPSLSLFKQYVQSEFNNIAEQSLKFNGPLT